MKKYVDGYPIDFDVPETLNILELSKWRWFKNLGCTPEESRSVQIQYRDEWYFLGLCDLVKNDFYYFLEGQPDDNPIRRYREELVFGSRLNEDKDGKQFSIICYREFGK